MVKFSRSPPLKLVETIPLRWVSILQASNIMVEMLHRASRRRCPGCRGSPNLYCQCLHGFRLLILASNIFLFCCFATNIHAFTLGSLFGRCVRDDGNYAHPSSTSHPLVSDNDDSRAYLLSCPSPEDFRVLMTDSGLMS